MTLKKVFDLSNLSPFEIITYSQKQGLIANNYLCSKCNVDMTVAPIETVIDKYAWRCKKCRSRKSIRRGTWFSNSHLSLSSILQLTFFWCDKLERRIIRRELEISEATLVDWYNLCREICVEIMLNHCDTIGGLGKIVDIDESKIGKRKCNRGRAVEGKWVYGGVERNSNRCFLEVIEDRSRETLVPLIQKYIEPNTTIISDSWAPYDTLGEEGYQDLTVNHSLHIVDSETGAHKKSAEGLWSCIKRFLPDCNRKRGFFSSYLAEFMYRRIRKDEPCLYTAFLQDIARIYPPETRDGENETARA